MGDPYQRQRRIGRWLRPWNYQDDIARSIAIQADAVVIAVHIDHAHMQVEFVGISPSFEIVPPGSVAPLYVPRLEPNKNATFTLVGWSRGEMKKESIYGVA